jgi:hypothetical protein
MVDCMRAAGPDGAVLSMEYQPDPIQCPFADDIVRLEEAYGRG